MRLNTRGGTVVRDGTFFAVVISRIQSAHEEAPYDFGHVWSYGHEGRRGSRLARCRLEAARPPEPGRFQVAYGEVGDLSAGEAVGIPQTLRPPSTRGRRVSIPVGTAPGPAPGRRLRCADVRSCARQCRRHPCRPRLRHRRRGRGRGEPDAARDRRGPVAGCVLLQPRTGASAALNPPVEDPHHDRAHCERPCRVPERQ